MWKAVVCILVIYYPAFGSDTTDGIMYLSGAKGQKNETLEMPNCPYERCDEISADKDKGTKRYIQVMKKDLKTATKLLTSGVFKEHNVDAALALMGPLQKAINWKDSKPEPFLVETLARDYGITKEQYNKLFLGSVELLRKNNVCEGFIAKASICSFGVMGQSKDPISSRKEWESALVACPKFSYQWMLATAAISGDK